MQFFMGYPIDRPPYRDDANLTFNGIGLPVWFSRGTQHVAYFVQAGPWQSPDGSFTMADDEVLVRFAVPQPPAGTIQAREQPRPQVFAIFKRNYDIVTRDSLLYDTVNPFGTPQFDDPVCILFSFAHPAAMVGTYRSGDEIRRDNRGSLMKNP